VKHFTYRVPSSGSSRLHGVYALNLEEAEKQIKLKLNLKILPRDLTIRESREKL
jgi:hypothetical protein